MSKFFADRPLLGFLVVSVLAALISAWVLNPQSSPIDTVKALIGGLNLAKTVAVGQSEQRACGGGGMGTERTTSGMAATGAGGTAGSVPRWLSDFASGRVPQPASAMASAMQGAEAKNRMQEFP